MIRAVTVPAIFPKSLSRFRGLKIITATIIDPVTVNTAGFVEILLPLPRETRKNRRAYTVIRRESSRLISGLWRSACARCLQLSTRSGQRGCSPVHV